MKTNNKISQIVVLLSFLLGTLAMRSQEDPRTVMVNNDWYLDKVIIDSVETPYNPGEENIQSLFHDFYEYTETTYDFWLTFSGAFEVAGDFTFIDSTQFLFEGFIQLNGSQTMTTDNDIIGDWYELYIDEFWKYWNDYYEFTINEIEDDLQLIIENPAGDKVYYQDVPNLDAPSFQQKEIAVYPNPVQNTLYLEGLRAEATLQLYDVSGKKIFDQPVQEETQIEVGNLSGGIYFYQISQSGKAIKTGKLVKE